MLHKRLPILLLLTCVLVATSGCLGKPSITGGIDNATYNPSTGDIGGSVNFGVEFKKLQERLDAIEKSVQEKRP